jgi:hypothetical protein
VWRIDRLRCLFIAKTRKDKIGCKERGRDKIKSTGNGKVPKKLMPDPVNGETVAQSMAESRGSDSNVELNDTRINQTSSPM